MSGMKFHLGRIRNIHLRRTAMVPVVALFSLILIVARLLLVVVDLLHGLVNAVPLIVQYLPGFWQDQRSLLGRAREVWSRGYVLPPADKAGR